MQLSYCVEESPLGTAGSVKNAADLLEGDEPFLVISGDALTDFDLQSILRAHKETGRAGNDDAGACPQPAEFGVVVTDEEARSPAFWRSRAGATSSPTR